MHHIALKYPAFSPVTVFDPPTSPPCRAEPGTLTSSPRPPQTWGREAPHPHQETKGKKIDAFSRKKVIEFTTVALYATDMQDGLDPFGQPAAAEAWAAEAAAGAEAEAKEAAAGGCRR